MGIFLRLSARTLSLALIVTVGASPGSAAPRNALIEPYASCTAVSGASRGIARPASRAGPFAYKTRSRSFGSEALARFERRTRGADVTVHWVATGPDAPPARSTYVKGVPDYVLSAASAADAAIKVYADPQYKGWTAIDGRFFPREHPPFLAPPCDRDGPTSGVDIYIKNLRDPGKAILPSQGTRGSFILVDNDLKPSRHGSRNYYGLLSLTVTHEVFHLIQFAYVPRSLPPWIGEGTAHWAATAVARFADRSSLKEANVIETRWRRQPWMPYYAASNYCERCYGGGQFWFFDSSALLSDSPERESVIQSLFARLGSDMRAGRQIGNGTDAYIDTVREQALAGWDEIPNNPIPKSVAESWPREAFTMVSFLANCENLYGSKDPWSGWATPRKKIPSTYSESATLNGMSCLAYEIAFRPGASQVHVSWEFDGSDRRLEPMVQLLIGGEIVPRKLSPKRNFKVALDNTRGHAYGLQASRFDVDLTESTRAGVAFLIFSSGQNKPRRLRFQMWTP